MDSIPTYLPTYLCDFFSEPEPTTLPHTKTSIFHLKLKLPPHTAIQRPLEMLGKKLMDTLLRKRIRYQ